MLTCKGVVFPYPGNTSFTCSSVEHGHAECGGPMCQWQWGRPTTNHHSLCTTLPNNIIVREKIEQGRRYAPCSCIVIFPTNYSSFVAIIHPNLLHTSFLVNDGVLVLIGHAADLPSLFFHLIIGVFLIPHSTIHAACVFPCLC